MFLRIKKGFTLTELLVGLSILSLLGAVALPKILNASAGTTANAKVHNAAQAVTNGLERWTRENGRSNLTTPENIMSVVQHSGLAADGRVLDFTPSLNEDFTCRPTSTALYEGTCYQMSDGAILYFIGSPTWDTFGGNANNALYFAIDPDGIASESISQDNNSVATAFLLYANGRLRERGRLRGNNSGEPQWTPNYYRQ
jgi:prepilin-type N-terminal cleavage/methylation domain-containing protein